MREEIRITAKVSVVPIEEVPNHENLQLFTDNEGNVTKMTVKGDYVEENIYLDIDFSYFNHKQVFEFVQVSHKDLMEEIFSRELKAIRNASMIRTAKIDKTLN